MAMAGRANSQKKILPLEVKFSVQATPQVSIPPSFRKFFPSINAMTVATFGGNIAKIGRESLRVPLTLT